MRDLRLRDVLFFSQEQRHKQQALIGVQLQPGLALSKLFVKTLCQNTTSQVLQRQFGCMYATMHIVCTVHTVILTLSNIIWYKKLKTNTFLNKL